MPIVKMGGWSREDAVQFKCRVHGVVDNMLKIEVRNEQFEVVFDRRYCSICFDQFLQQHLDPLVEIRQEVEPR